MRSQLDAVPRRSLSGIAWHRWSFENMPAEIWCSCRVSWHLCRNVFPHLVRTLTWFYCRVRHVRRWLMWIGQWQGSADQPSCVAIDGKTVRHSVDRKREQSPLHVVSAWASEHRLVLGQVAVDSKSNEITAIPDLLRQVKSDGDISTEKRLFISSTSADDSRLASAIRQHWSIENSLHWVLDVTFHEDASRVRERNACQNLALRQKNSLESPAKRCYQRQSTWTAKANRLE